MAGEASAVAAEAATLRGLPGAAAEAPSATGDGVGAAPDAPRKEAIARAGCGARTESEGTRRATHALRRRLATRSWSDATRIPARIYHGLGAARVQLKRGRTTNKQKNARHVIRPTCAS